MLNVFKKMIFLCILEFIDYVFLIYVFLKIKDYLIMIDRMIYLYLIYGKICI